MAKEIPERKSVKVRKGNAHLTVYPWRDAKGKNRWRFAWREDESAPWKYVTKTKKADAIAAAEARLDESVLGGLVWSSLPGSRRRFLESVHREATREDEDAVLAFIRQRQKSAEIVASVARFLAFKVAGKGEETRNLANVRRNLEPMATHFAGRMLTDIHSAELLEWWTTRCAGLKEKTALEVRGSLVAFWNWAVKEKLHPKDTTPADSLPRPEVGLQERRVLTVEEMKGLLTKVNKEFRAWVVLGAFAGLRPEEISPPKKKGMSKKAKRGLLCEEIDWQFSVIRLQEAVSKGGKTARIIPLNDACKAGLLWAGVHPGHTGPVCGKNPVEQEETARLGREVFKDGWPQDALRHTYGSARIAQIQSKPQVALEMGNSVAMLDKHYHNPRTKEEGDAWFAIRPVPISSDEAQVPAREYLDRVAGES